MESRLKWPDYLILVGFLVISLSIGIYHLLTGGRQKTTAEFIMGNRRLKVIPTAISLFVSFQSAISLLGMSAEVYSYGIHFLIYFSVTVLLGLLLIERFIVPWIYPMKLVSIYDYLERRYMSKSVKILGALMGIFYANLYMGVMLYAPSSALEAATGVPLSVSIPVMAVVSATYTAIGGMRAVIWTDVFQFIAMFVGLVAILVRGVALVGGITKVLEVSGTEGRLVLDNFTFDPRERHAIWIFLIGSVMSIISGYGLSQSSVQRYSAVDKLWKARIMMLLNIPALIVTYTISSILGLIVVAYYSSIKCDPLVNKDIANPNMLLPYFVTTIFGDVPGFIGLFLAALYGATLSSMSSWLSGAAANCWDDILAWKLNHLPETRKVLINRFLVVFFGVSSIGMAFCSASVPGPITQVTMAMINSISGPLFAFFALGAVSKLANWKGMLLGGIVGISASLWLSIGSMTVRYNYPLPPLSVEHCSLGNGNATFNSTALNFTKYNASFQVFSGNGDKDFSNDTTKVFSAEKQRVAQLRGLENFYAISYMSLVPFGAIVTGVIGIIASFIMRDKELESMVDERLLLRFHGCGWSDRNENKNHSVEKDLALVLEKPEDESEKTIEIVAMRETENRFNKESQRDLQKHFESGLLTIKGRTAKAGKILSLGNSPAQPDLTT